MHKKNEESQSSEEIKHEEELRKKAQQQRLLDSEVMQIKHDMRRKINELDARMAESALPRKGYAKPPKNLKAGDSVMIINLNRRGTVMDGPDKDGNVIIQVGIMKVNMHITQLKVIDEQKELVDNIQNTRISGVKSGNVGLELDIRGCNIEEAREKISKYLDDVTIAGLHEVTIIHGKGTGALRKGVHEILKSNPHVKTFRLGKYGEGESGVTVVKIRD